MKDELNFWQSLPRPILALAPMVGISDSAFRQICKRWGAHVVYTEMISADALVYRNEKTIGMLAHDASEYPLVAQFMAKEPKVLAEAARIAEAQGVSGIDINFGCPAHKIAKNACGAVLMRDLDRCYALIEAALEAVSIPVSVKTRVSIKSRDARNTEITILDFLEKVSNLPIAAIMVHGRSFEDPFEGGVRVPILQEVKKAFTNGPVIANGGIQTVEDSKEFLLETGADGIGFARSAIGKPWIFQQVSEYLASGTYQEPEWLHIKERIIEHVSLYDTLRDEAPFQDIRKHLSKYVRGHENASRLRQMLVQTSSLAEIQKVLATA